MKKLLLAITLLIPFTALASTPLEYELIRTTEAPGFFAVTIYPGTESTPITQQFTFVKNFPKTQESKYQPVLDFLTEIGANIINKESTLNPSYITLGEPISNEINFQTSSNNSLEEFEEFTLQHLRPMYLRNIQAEFGGNITAVSQTQNNLTGDQGVTFIGKFEKEMRTRMNITAEDETHYISFDTPLNLRDRELANSPLATQLPNLWEDMQPKPLVSTNNLIEAFPWVLAALGLLILAVIFTRNTKRKYNEFLEQQDNLQEELPWQQISKQESAPSNPFEVQ